MDASPLAGEFVQNSQQMDRVQICADGILSEITADLFNALYDIAEHVQLKRTPLATIIMPYKSLLL